MIIILMNVKLSPHFEVMGANGAYFGLLENFEGLYREFGANLTMPKSKSNITNDEDFIKFYNKKFGKMPQMFNEYGENKNTVIIKSSPTSNGLKVRVTSDIASIACKRLEKSNHSDGMSRKYRELSLAKVGESEILREFFTLTREPLREQTQQLFTPTGEVNLNILRYSDISSEDGIRISYRGVFQAEKVELWAKTLNSILGKLQNELMKPISETFRGTLEIKNVSSIQFVEEQKK